MAFFLCLNVERPPSTIPFSCRSQQSHLAQECVSPLRLLFGTPQFCKMASRHENLVMQFYESQRKMCHTICGKSIPENSFYITEMYPPFLRIPFFLLFSPVHATPPQAIFCPKNPHFLGLRNTLLSRGNRGLWVLGFGGGV